MVNEHRLTGRSTLNEDVHFLLNIRMIFNCYVSLPEATLGGAPVAGNFAGDPFLGWLSDPFKGSLPTRGANGHFESPGIHIYPSYSFLFYTSRT